MSHVKGLRWLHPSSLLTCNTLSSLGLALLLACRLSWGLMVLATPTCWGHYCNPCSISLSHIVASQGLSGTYLTLVTILNFRERFHSFFPLSYIFHSAKARTAWPALLSLAACLGWSMAHSLDYLDNSFPGFFRVIKSFRPFPFTSLRVSWMEWLMPCRDHSPCSPLLQVMPCRDHSRAPLCFRPLLSSSTNLGSSIRFSDVLFSLSSLHFAFLFVLLALRAI